MASGATVKSGWARSVQNSTTIDPPSATEPENEKSTTSPTTEPENEKTTTPPGAPTTPPKKPLAQILELTDFKFHVIFQGTPQARTTSVSSTGLKTAAGVDSIWDVTLKTVRDRGELPKAYLFCINGTNTVTDDTDLGRYISLTKDNITALQNADADPETSAIITVQYTSRHRPPPKELPKPPTLPTAPAQDSKLPEIKDHALTDVTIATTGLVAAAGEIASTHPAEMTNKQWDYVMVTNSLLHGMYLDPATHTFHKARYPAFKLKESFPDPLDIDLKKKKKKPGSKSKAKIDPKSKATGETKPKDEGDPKLKAEGDPKSKDPESKDESDSESEAETHEIYIPAFEVNDDCSITITEVKTTYELSMAQNAFNSSSVEASVSGGFGPVSAGVSGSASWSSSHSSASKQSGKIDILHASYNFPRVKVFLDADDLVVTDDCQKLLDTIQKYSKPDDVAKFYRKYGHIFVGTVQLGKNAMKAAAAVSISTPYASASVSASHANGKESESGDKSGTGSENLAWEAQGGETLLASNPPAWIASVGSFYNWRVIERSNVCDIMSLLKETSQKSAEWSTIFNRIQATRDRLVFVNPLRNVDEIEILNSCGTTVQVAVTNATSSDQSAGYIKLDKGQSSKWTRTGNECVFINDVGSDLIAIAMAQPGIYEIKRLESAQPPTPNPYSNGGANQIGIKNNTANTILVSVTSSGQATWFYALPPGKTDHWSSRNDSETIFVKHLSSNTLHTYFGDPGKDLRVDEPHFSSFPDLHDAPGEEDKIYVSNTQYQPINAKVSNASRLEGLETFAPFHPETKGAWDRKRQEVIYINGPHGTAVGAYFGKPGRTLVVDHPISYDGK